MARRLIGRIARPLALLAVAAAALAVPATATPAAAAAPVAGAEGGSGSASFFVSPRGDDGNPGTAAQPVRTLERARQLVRTVNQSMQGDVVVTLGEGTYELSQPLTFDPADSGFNGHQVIYRAAAGHRPVVSGGLSVTGWTLADPARNLWSAPAPAGLTNTRQLYVNGVRAQRARGRAPVTLTRTDTGYTADSPLMASWRNPADVEFVYTGGNTLWSETSANSIGAWTEPRCPVASIVGTTITMAQPCWDNADHRLPRTTAFVVELPAGPLSPASASHYADAVLGLAS